MCDRFVFPTRTGELVWYQSLLPSDERDGSTICGNGCVSLRVLSKGVSRLGSWQERCSMEKCLVDTPGCTDELSLDTGSRIANKQFMI